MTLWQYRAVPLALAGSSINPGGTATVQTGELPGETAADVRAALRRVGLQVIDLRPHSTAAGVWGWLGRSNPLQPTHKTPPVVTARREQGPITRGLLAIQALFRGRWLQHLRQRRARQRAELYDSLATMLESGLPLLDAIDTLISSSEGKGSALRNLLTAVREDLREGASLGLTMENPRNGGPGWFNAIEVAIVHAAHTAGNLSTVLRKLAIRSERAGEMTRRLIGALTYPAIVAVVGLGVVIFLSLKTLPGLVRVLEQAHLPVPPLTEAVMGFGGLIAGQWFLLVLAAATAIVGATLIPALVLRVGRVQRQDGSKFWIGRCLPRVTREMATARFARQLAELIDAGVPIVEAIQVIAPSGRNEGASAAAPTAGIVGAGLSDALLHQSLREASQRMQRGEDLAAALNDPLFFSAEFRRLIDVGQASGELPAILQRLAERSERRVTRLIDRLAALLEPTVILVLAALIGTVVMAALLPLLRLQQMFG